MFRRRIYRVRPQRVERRSVHDVPDLGRDRDCDSVPPACGARLGVGLEKRPFSKACRTCRPSAKLLIGENVPETLKCDLQIEQAARPMYQEAIAYCESVKDYITRELLENILESEEEHIDWLDNSSY